MNARRILFALTILACACSSDRERIEGTEPGDCQDDADNDGDGLFDCADPSCAGASNCAMPDGGMGDVAVVRAGTDALWQVRCPSGAAGCAAPGEVVDALAFSGDDGVTVRCSFSELPGNSRLFNAIITVNQNQQLSVGNLPITPEGAVTGTGTVRILDQDIDLEGDVGAAAPTEGTPCQIGPLTFSERSEGPAASFSLLCRNIANPANPDLTRRDVTFPDMSGTPAEISVFNCDGL